MSIFSKNKKIILICFLYLFVLSSCATNNPIKKNNKAFLNKYSKKIEKSKKKHKEAAKKSGISYKKIDNINLMDSSYYTNRNGTNKIKLDVLSNDLPPKEKNEYKINYLESSLSIYYKERTLKDNLNDLGYDFDEKSKNLRYLLNNKDDFSETKTMFYDIEPSKEKLYGELKQRDNYGYTSINNDILLVNYDYIDIMNRVKKEIYLKNKEQSKTEEPEPKKHKKVDSLKNKFKSIFNKD